MTIPSCFQGIVKHDLVNGKANPSHTDDKLATESAEKIAAAWVSGVDVDWSRLYPGKNPRRISLPTYPFAEDRYWVDEQTMPHSQPLAEETVAKVSSTLPDVEVILGQPYWQPKSAQRKATSAGYAQHQVLFCNMKNLQPRCIEQQLKGVTCVRLHSSKPLLMDRYQDVAGQVFGHVKNLIAQKPKDKLLLQLLILNEAGQGLFSGLSGLLKTAHWEYPNLITQTIEMSRQAQLDELVNIIRDDSHCPFDTHVRYHQQQRQVLGWQEIPINFDDRNIPWKDNGVYLITGGVGGLGLLFSEEIARQAQKSKLVLSGRSVLNSSQQTRLDNLIAMGATVVYRQADVCQRKDIGALVEYIKDEFGQLDGVLHAAGLNQSNFIWTKTTAEFDAVLAPKVAGTVILDEATQSCELDFFVLFSSIASVKGSVGQADYATANGFMDSFASHRNGLVAKGQRFGQTLSINWPLWQSGGMKIDSASESLMRQTTGLLPMPTAIGMKAFSHCLLSAQDQCLVALGEGEKIRAWCFAGQKRNERSEGFIIPNQRTLPVLKENIERQLKQLLGATLRLSPDKIDALEPLESYGIDSIAIVQLNQQLAEIFGEISKTLFYEYQALGELVDYFMSNHPQPCAAWCGMVDEKRCQCRSSG